MINRAAALVPVFFSKTYLSRSLRPFHFLSTFYQIIDLSNYLAIYFRDCIMGDEDCEEIHVEIFEENGSGRYVDRLLDRWIER